MANRYPSINVGSGGGPNPGGSTDSAVWGKISGTLPAQADLQAALDDKAPVAAQETAVWGKIAGSIINQPDLIDFLTGVGGSGAEVVVYQLGNEPIGTALTAGQGKDYLRATRDFTIVGWLASIYRPSTSGAVQFDVNVNGLSVFTTDKVTIDANEKSSATASTPAEGIRINVHADSEITVDVDAAGMGATGWRLTLYGVRTTLGAAPLPPVPPAIAPTLNGLGAVGNVLTVAGNTGWSNAPLGYSYEWMRDGVVVDWTSGASYTAVSADAGRDISVRVTASNGGGQASVLTSNSVRVATPAPVNLSAPVIVGEPIESQAVTVNPGQWLYATTFAYQWKRDGVAIPMANVASRTLTQADTGHEITCTVTASNSLGVQVAVTTAAVTPEQMDAAWNFELPWPERSGTMGRELNIGPGEEYEELSDMPYWDSLLPGDHIKIHYRETPYVGLMYLGSRGTETDWIEIEGIPNEDGERPAITGVGGRAVSGLTSMPGIGGAGVFVIGRPTTGPNPKQSGYKPGYIWIHGLKIGGARPPNTYIRDNGTTATFSDFVAAIYCNPVEHLTVSDNELHSCSMGLFANSRNDAADQSSYIHVCGNWFRDNGRVGDYSVHNAYTEIIGAIYEYNWFEGLTPGAYGDSIKDRSAGNIFRYNHFSITAVYGISIRDPDSNPTHSAVQIDHLREILVSHAFVYGNVFEMMAGPAIGHGDGDYSNTGLQNRYGDVCVYSNIFVSRKNFTNIYAADEQVLFQPLSYASPGGNVVWRAVNNMIYQGAAVTSPTTSASICLFTRAGVADFGPNLINSFLNIHPNPGGYSNNTFAGIPFDGTGLGGLTAQEYDPKFTNYAARDYSLQADSPFFDLKGAIPSAAADRDLWPDDRPIAAPPVLSQGPSRPTSPYPVATVRPVVTGDTEIGSELSVTNGTWNSATSVSFTYQWTRDGLAIEDDADESIYTLTPADGGKTIVCIVYATNAVGRSSRNTVAVPIPVDPRVPGKLTDVAITAPATGAGALLTATPGTWSNTPSSTRYQWYVDGGAIPSKTGATYQTLGSQAGKSITVRQWATNVYGESLPNVSAPFVLTEAVPIEPDEEGFFAFDLPDGTTLADANPKWTGKPALFEVLDGALQVIPASIAGVETTFFNDGASSATTQRITAVRRGSGSIDGFSLSICGGGYTARFVFDNMAFSRNGTYIASVYYTALGGGGVDFTDDTEFTLEKAGSAVNVKANGETFYTFTDGAPISSGYCGFILNYTDVALESMLIERF